MTEFHGHKRCSPNNQYNIMSDPKPRPYAFLGDRSFVQWVREKLGDRGKVDENQPDSEKVFALEIAEVVRATARVYGKGVEDLRRKRRGEENEARSMAMYLSRV